MRTKKPIRKTSIKKRLSDKKKVKHEKAIKKKEVPINSKPVKKVKHKKIKRGPREILCVVSGQKFKISPSILKKQALKLKFECEDEYVKYYICKDARKFLKEGFSVSEVRKKYNYVSDLEIPFKILKCYVKVFKNREAIERRNKNKRIQEIINSPTKLVMPKTERISYNLNIPEHVAKLTDNNCWRPDLFLDYDRTCVGCALYPHCKCSSKRMPKNAK